MRMLPQEASVLFVELYRFNELALASKTGAVMKLLNDVFWDVSRFGRVDAYVE